MLNIQASRPHVRQKEGERLSLKQDQNLFVQGKLSLVGFCTCFIGQNSDIRPPQVARETGKLSILFSVLWDGNDPGVRLCRFESQYKLYGLNPSTSSMTNTSSMTLAKKDLCASVSLICKMGLVIQLTLEQCRG